MRNRDVASPKKEKKKLFNVLIFFTVLKEKFRLEPSDVGVPPGGVAKMECAPPKGSPPPTVFWKKNGKVLDLDKEDKERYEIVNEKR